MVDDEIDWANYDYDKDDDSPDESEADPIDALLSNADWPKRWDDTDEGIQARIDAAGPGRPFIHAEGWYAWLDYDTMGWAADEPEKAPLKMMAEGFPRPVIDKYVDDDKTLRELYADVVEFLEKWGVKADVVD